MASRGDQVYAPKVISPNPSPKPKCSARGVARNRTLTAWNALKHGIRVLCLVSRNTVPVVPRPHSRARP